MASSLFGKNENGMGIGDALGILRGDKRSLMRMVEGNPQFQKFVQENQGKSPEEIARKYGISMNDVNKMMNEINGSGRCR